MNGHHKEIVSALENIVTTYKEFATYEKKLTGNQEIKKKMNSSTYLMTILDHEARLQNTKHIKRKLFSMGKMLNNAQPDFGLSNGNKTSLQNYINVVGKTKISERTKLQFELLELMEFKAEFLNLSDLVSEIKIKRLEEYLKGKK